MAICVDGVALSGCAKADGNLRLLCADGNVRCTGGLLFTVPNGAILDPTLARVSFLSTGLITTASTSTPGNPNWTGSWHEDAPDSALGADYEIRYQYSPGGTNNGITSSSPSIGGIAPNVWTVWTPLSSAHFVQMNTAPSGVFIPDELTLTVEIRPAGGGVAITQTFYLADG